MARATLSSASGSKPVPKRPPASSNRLLLTCEHGGNRIPREYAPLFRGAKRVLASHRGWDPGALALARSLARHFGLPLHSVTWSRLLVESNRAPANWRIWSSYTRGLPSPERERILERFWWPHRRSVEAAVRKGVTSRCRVVHIAVHSFTPILDGEVRNLDIGLLYDSRRPAEKALCTGWEKILVELDPTLRLRRNYPYRGATDGFPTWLRRRFAGNSYVGVELELSQALLAGPRRRQIERVLATSIERLLRG